MMRLGHTFSALLAVACCMGAAQAGAGPAPAAPSSTLKTVLVQATNASDVAVFEARVEAVTQAVMAAQVAGRVVQLHVQAGDLVQQGALLLRVDAQAAQEGTSAAQAQVAAAQTQQQLAKTQLERQQQLHAKGYISQAVVDQAQAAYKAAQAQVQAMQAQRNATQAQQGFFSIHAPFGGVVAQVHVDMGSMAMPGSPLLSMYDPSALRITAAVPNSLLLANASPTVQVQINGQLLPALRVEVLPTVDTTTLTQTVRAYLPAGSKAAPGQYARMSISGQATAQQASKNRLTIPTVAVVRRAELVGVYVLSQQGRPLLRQIRTGSVLGESVEVLTGLDAGEQVVIEPQAVLRNAGARQ